MFGVSLLAAWLLADLRIGRPEGALLFAGSRFMVNGAVSIAQSLGVSEAVSGLTLVAAGTSMPELVTCVVAALKKEPDIALGNIIGRTFSISLASSASPRWPSR